MKNDFKDYIAMILVASMTSACIFDLFVRASDPYRIRDLSANSIDFPASSVAGHHVAMGVPQSRDMEVQPWPVNGLSTQSRRPSGQVETAQWTLKGQAASRQEELSSSIEHDQKEVIPAVGRTKPFTTGSLMNVRAEGTLDGHPSVKVARCEVTTYGLEYRPGGRRNRKGKAGTSSGSRYDYRDLTCAVNRIGGRPALRFGTLVTINYKGRSVTCKVTDTGGHRPRKGAKIWFDLSCAAMAKLTGKPLNPQRAYNTTFFATWEPTK